MKRPKSLVSFVVWVSFTPRFLVRFICKIKKRPKSQKRPKVKKRGPNDLKRRKSWVSFLVWVSFTPRFLVRFIGKKRDPNLKRPELKKETQICKKRLNLQKRDPNDIKKPQSWISFLVWVSFIPRFLVRFFFWTKKRPKLKKETQTPKKRPKTQKRPKRYQQNEILGLCLSLFYTTFLVRFKKRDTNLKKKEFNSKKRDPNDIKRPKSWVSFLVWVSFTPRFLGKIYLQKKETQMSKDIQTQKKRPKSPKRQCKIEHSTPEDQLIS